MPELALSPSWHLSVHTQLLCSALHSTLSGCAGTEQSGRMNVSTLQQRREPFSPRAVQWVIFLGISCEVTPDFGLIYGMPQTSIFIIL